MSTGRRRELGARLRRFRELKGYNGSELAAKLHWTPSMLSRVESGKRPASEREILLYMGMCGIADKRLQDLLDLNDEPDDFRIKVHPDQIPDELQTLISLESNATTIESYQPIYIPGIMQTPEYARTVFDEGGNFDEAGIDMRVTMRLSRRDVLTRFHPAKCRLFVHETALRTMVGSPKIMNEQLLHLVFVSDRPQCSIRVVPTSAGCRGLANGSFNIFHYAEDSPVVYAEHEHTSDFLENSELVWAYGSVLDRVDTVALGEAESRSMIAALASQFDPGVVDERMAQEQL